MSKAKMKKAVDSARIKQNPPSPQNKKAKREKKPWIKPKDFKFLKPIKFLPGFRSAKHWKRIIAMTYYCAIPFSMILKFGDFQYFGIFIFVMLLSLPFLICSLVSFINTKDRFYAVETLISAVVFGADNYLLMHFMREMITNIPK